MYARCYILMREFSHTLLNAVNHCCQDGGLAVTGRREEIDEIIFSSQFAPQMHVSEALKVLQTLNEEEK